MREDVWYDDNDIDEDDDDEDEDDTNQRDLYRTVYDWIMSGEGLKREEEEDKNK